MFLQVWPSPASPASGKVAQSPPETQKTRPNPQNPNTRKTLGGGTFDGCVGVIIFWPFGARNRPGKPYLGPKYALQPSGQTESRPKVSLSGGESHKEGRGVIVKPKNSKIPGKDNPPHPSKVPLRWFFGFLGFLGFGDFFESRDCFGQRCLAPEAAGRVTK